MSDKRRPLEGKHILVVEDDQMVADVVMETLQDHGASVAGPIASVAECHAIGSTADLDGAVVAFGLADGSAASAIRSLRDRGVPLIILSGYTRDYLPKDLMGEAFVSKPYRVAELVDAACRRFKAAA